MWSMIYELLKVLGPYAPFVNFAFICGVLYVALVIRSNDLTHIEEAAKQIRIDLVEYRKDLQHDIDHIRDRVDKLVDHLINKTSTH